MNYIEKIGVLVGKKPYIVIIVFVVLLWLVNYIADGDMTQL